jgi:hypothetical protein
MQKTTDLSIDFSLIPANVPAICIPYVFENIGEKRIEGIFKDLDIGKVERIDLVPTTNQAPNGSKVNRVFIHINWKIDEATDKIRTKLLCGKEVKVLYDGKYFWKISASRAKEGKAHPPTQVHKDTKPRIEMDDSPREHRGPPREHRGPPRDHGPPREHHGRDHHHGPPREHRDHHGREPRDYRPKGDFVPRQVPPPMAPCLGDMLSLQDPGAFVRPESWDEDEFQYKESSAVEGMNPMYQPTTPPTPSTPPPKDTRPLADIDYHEKVPATFSYEGVGDETPPKKKKSVKKAAKDPVEVKEVEE